MSYPDSVKDRELKKFREKPSGSGKTVVAVELVQDLGDSIDVNLKAKGITKNTFNEVSAVPKDIETLINSYTTPLGKNFDLNKVSCSGDNRARFIVKVDGNTIGSKRSWFCDFNVEFEFLEDTITEGKKIEIFVINNGDDSVDFESTITGGVYAN